MPIKKKLFVKKTKLKYLGKSLEFFHNRTLFVLKNSSLSKLFLKLEINSRYENIFSRHYRLNSNGVLNNP